MQGSKVKLLSFVLLISVSSSSKAWAISGQSSGVFVNYYPPNSIVSGVGTDHFSWGGSIFFGGGSSSFTFSGGNIDSNESIFYLGKLSYHNAQTALGTEAQGVSLNLRVNINFPEIVSREIQIPINITTTPNSDPNSSGDVIELPESFPDAQFVIGGAIYTLKIHGFGTILSTEALDLVSRFQTAEDGDASANIIAVLVSEHNTTSDIVALGDSIPAGYGIGPTDANELSYPGRIAALWGEKNGHTILNLASTGAVSGDCESFCTIKCSNEDSYNEDCFHDCVYGSGNPKEPKCHSVLDDQLVNALNSSPRIITLTVGANDISFGDCLKTWFSGDFLNNPTANKCWTTNEEFQYRLDLLSFNLNEIFSKAESSGVEVFVTTYYNPLPKSGAKLCKQFYMPVAANAMYFQNGKIGTLGEIKQFARSIQDNTSSFATSVLNELNKVIILAASKHSNVRVVNLNFSGHDFCRSENSAWAYGTSLDSWYTYWIKGIFPKTISSNLSLPNVCPFPREIESVPIVSLGNEIFGLRYTSNCMPHPTKSGQVAIAKKFIKAFKVSGIN